MSYSKSTSPALAALVKFMTRPLLASYPAATVMALHLSLEASLAHLFAGPTNSGFMFALTATSAPAAVYAAATASGVAWGEWMNAMGGADLHFVISDKSVRVGITEKLERGSSITLWSAPAPTRVEEESDSETDSDSSSTFSFGRSDDEESLSSVSSTSSPISKTCELPTVSKPFLRAPTTCAPRYQPPARRLAAKPAVKAEVTNYLYEGGATSVVGGGVLLGAAKATGTPAFRVVSKAIRPSPPPVARSQRKPTKAADSSNWRRV